jgi:hypothetical protein
MTTIKAKTVVLSIAVMIILAGVFVLTRKKPEPKTPSEKVAAAIGEISKANVGLPAPQIDAKALIMTASVFRGSPHPAYFAIFKPFSFQDSKPPSISMTE